MCGCAAATTSHSSVSTDWTDRSVEFSQTTESLQLSSTPRKPLCLRETRCKGFGATGSSGRPGKIDKYQSQLRDAFLRSDSLR